MAAESSPAKETARFRSGRCHNFHDVTATYVIILSRFAQTFRGHIAGSNLHTWAYCDACENTCNPCDVTQDAGFFSVQLHSSEYTRTEVDLSIPGRGFPWQFSRTYRSGITFDGPLGFNWDFKDNRRLVVVNGANLVAVQTSFPTAAIGDAVRIDGEGRTLTATWSLSRRPP